MESNVQQKAILRHKILIEIIWWLVTAIVVILAMLPLWKNVPDFPFFKQNILLIVLFITFFRYTFFLKLTFIAHLKWIKVVIIACSVLFFFVTTTAVTDFRGFMDNEGLQSIVDHLHVLDQARMIRYMKHEMVFFGVGATITGILLPIRMIISIWRGRNKGTV